MGTLVKSTSLLVFYVLECTLVYVNQIHLCLAFPARCILIFCVVSIILLHWSEFGIWWHLISKKNGNCSQPDALTGRA